MEQRPTVYIVDDDAGVRHSLMHLVQMMRLECRAFASGQAFLDQGQTSRPACVIVDLKMPGISGLELLQTLAASHSPVPAVVITGHGDVPIAVRAMKAGAFDFLEKPYEPLRLRESIWKALESDRKHLAEHPSELPPLGPLTGQEHAVLRAIVDGRTNRDIAAMLDVSIRTVQLRRSALRRKLGAKTRAELIARARELARRMDA